MDKELVAEIANILENTSEDTIKYILGYVMYEARSGVSIPYDSIVKLINMREAKS